MLKTIFAALLFALTVTAAPAFCADSSAQPPPGPPGEYAQSYGDPLAPFNEKMFWFNLKLDKYVLHPVASGYAFVLPKPARQSVGNFFNNVNFIPRFANNLFHISPNTFFDPELNTQGAGNIRGLDLQGTPNARTMGASLKVSF